MFDFLSWGHVVVIALAALFIFGPERLPSLAKDAARGVKGVRATLQSARAQLDESLGDDFGSLREFDPRKYRPKAYLRAQLFGDEPFPSVWASGAEPFGSAMGTLGVSGRAGSPASVPAGPRVLPPPFDPDAT